MSLIGIWSSARAAMRVKRVGRRSDDSVGCASGCRQVLARAEIPAVHRLSASCCRVGCNLSAHRLFSDHNLGRRSRDDLKSATSA